MLLLGIIIGAIIGKILAKKDILKYCAKEKSRINEEIEKSNKELDRIKSQLSTDFSLSTEEICNLKAELDKENTWNLVLKAGAVGTLDKILQEANNK